MEIAVKPGQWGWTFEELRASWQAAEQCGFDRLSCFDHVSADGGQRAWDAPTLLAVMAAETDHIPLAVHVLNAALRNPFLLAGQLAVAQAASGGRLEVGLGTGSAWARNDHQVAGIPFPTFPERVARLEAICRVLPALWRGEEVTEEALGLRGASLGPLGIEVPPLIVGGQSEGVLEVAARHAEVWSGYGHDPEVFAEAARRLDAACQRVGRTRPILHEGQVFANRFASGHGFQGLREHLRRLEKAGAERAVVVLYEVRGPDAVRGVAEAVLD